MSVEEKIKDTKEHGILYRTSLLGDGTQENPYSPEIMKEGAYFHFDTKTIDKINNTAEVWVNKKKTSKAVKDKIKADTKYEKIKETGE
jgi:hypothetical protein